MEALRASELSYLAQKKKKTWAVCPADWVWSYTLVSPELYQPSRSLRERRGSERAGQITRADNGVVVLPSDGKRNLTFQIMLLIKIECVACEGLWREHMGTVLFLSLCASRNKQAGQTLSPKSVHLPPKRSLSLTNVMLTRWLRSATEQNFFIGTLLCQST